ncbi:unnamed protein product [Nesidiocoris tenuis]|uniref:Uncharacterized protein n=1 Tax=Nesidiocoris tenuis TaxID=355587 RepID=A0A6H5HGW2_9HEMI|nr:unnamed protein product [Nesidiocoris tenuis]
MYFLAGAVRSSRLASRVRAVPYPSVGQASGGQYSVPSVAVPTVVPSVPITVPLPVSVGASSTSSADECRCRSDLVVESNSCEAAQHSSRDAVQHHVAQQHVQQHASQQQTPMLFIPFTTVPAQHHLSLGGQQPAVSPSPASTPIIKSSVALSGDMADSAVRRHGLYMTTLLNIVVIPKPPSYVP